MNLKYKIIVAFLTLFCASSLLNAQNLTWVNTAGGTNADEGSAVIVDTSTDSVYVVGTFSGVVDFDPGAGVTNLTSAGETDIFIQKFDAAGNFLWVKQIGGTGAETVTAIAFERPWSIFIVGTYEGTVDFDPSPTATSNLTTTGVGSYHLRMSVTGGFTSVQNIGVPSANGSVTVTGVAVPTSIAGSTILIGTFTGTVDFDPTSGVNNITSQGGNDIFIQSLDHNRLTAEWTTTFGAAGNDKATAMFAANGGSFFLTGTFEGTVDFNSNQFRTNNLTAVGKEDVFVLNLSLFGRGSYTWGTSIGGKENDSATAIVSSFPNLYVTGTYQDTVDFNASTTAENKLIAKGEKDGFLLRLNENSGAYQSVEAIATGTTNSTVTTPKDVVLDRSGNIFVIGDFNNTVDFNPSTAVNNITSKGATDAFVLKLNSNRGFQWVKTFGSTGIDKANAIDMNTTTTGASPYIVGGFSGTVDFDPNTTTLNKTASGSTDIFVEKLGCALTVSVTKNGNVLTATPSGGTYQWINCSNNSPVAGATTQSYTPTASGSYSVTFTKEGCSNTSVCTSVTLATSPCTTNRPNVTRTSIATAPFTTTLSTNAVTGATYQWLNCADNNLPITNETATSYTPEADARAALEILRPNGCKDTSVCELVCNLPSSFVITKSGTTLTAPTVQGATYQWLDCNNSFSPIANETNQSYTPTASGRYQVEVLTAKTCRYHLPCVTVCIADKPAVAKTGNDLSITAVTGATYQWLDCGNSNAPIMSATTNTFTPTATGSYAIEITRNNSCKDTSVCTAVTLAATPCTSNKPAVAKTGNDLSITAVTGATYQWLDCGNSNAPIMSATTNTFTPTATGSYALEITRSNSCKDTSVCTAVTICTPNKPTVMVAGVVLSITPVTGATYQWLRCDNNNAVLATETNTTYTATINGRFSVAITRANSCKDTSVCTAVTGVGLIENTFATALKLYPNPTSDKVIIELGNNYSNIAVEITNVLGQVITSKTIATVTHRKIVLPINAPKGIYFVRIKAKEGFASFRIIKE